MNNHDPQIRTFPKELESHLDKISAQFMQSIKDIIPKDFSYEQNYKLFRSSIKYLSKNNWYVNFDMKMSQVIRAGLYIEKKQTNEANKFLKEYFDEEIYSLTSKMIRRFPNRKKVLIAAIEAHKEKQYYLSIPVFYSQAEGICQEITNIRLFSSKKGKPKTSKIVDEFNGSNLTLDLLDPLQLLNSNRQVQTPGKPIGINRHDILHGQSTNYGEDEYNSYKAFSLLNYITDIVFSTKKQKSR